MEEIKKNFKKIILKLIIKVVTIFLKEPCKKCLVNSCCNQQCSTMFKYESHVLYDLPRKILFMLKLFTLLVINTSFIAALIIVLKDKIDRDFLLIMILTFVLWICISLSTIKLIQLIDEEE